MTSPINPRHNKIFEALPIADLNRLSPHLELTPMPIGSALGGLDGKTQFAYFPTTSIVSLFCTTKNDNFSECASVGKEGMLGLSLVVGEKINPSLPIVHTAGFGYRLKAKLLVEEFNRCGVMTRLLLRYSQALINQISYTETCNKLHSIDQQLSRWILQTLDRNPLNDLSFPGELISNMFGESFEEIMKSLSKLQHAGIINYHLGRITVLDRPRLENESCECYRKIQMEFGRLHGLDFDWRSTPGEVPTWSNRSTNLRPENSHDRRSSMKRRRTDRVEYQNINP